MQYLGHSDYRTCIVVPYSMYMYRLCMWRTVHVVYLHNTLIMVFCSILTSIFRNGFHFALKLLKEPHRWCGSCTDEL